MHMRACAHQLVRGPHAGSEGVVEVSALIEPAVHARVAAREKLHLVCTGRRGVPLCPCIELPLTYTNSYACEESVC